MSNAVTQGIRVTVRTQYLQERSSPTSRQYAFAYTVKIKNEGTTTAQLKTRHWEGRWRGRPPTSATSRRRL
jgi:uncharacterized protein affecting Mg2+/Co2+ transport